MEVLSAIIVAMSILILAVVINTLGKHFDGIAQMFFAIQAMQLRVELEELEWEVPEWLKSMWDEDEPLPMEPPTELKLVKTSKDKQEE